MQQGLEIQDIDPSKLREKQLKERVHKDLKGGAISYAYTHADPQTYGIWKGFKGWLKREKWWFSAVFATTVLCSTLWMSWNFGWIRFTIFLVGVWLGLVLSFCLGTTNGSRALITLFWSVVSAIVTISVFARSDRGYEIGGYYYYN